MTQIYPDIIITDEQDNPIGVMQLPDALREKQIIRVVRVFLFNAAGELLLQKRSKHIIAPNLWCESAAGHVDEGETYEQSAHRELEEELSVDTDLTHIDTTYNEETTGEYQSKYFSAIFTGTHEGPFEIEPFEVAEVRWVAPKDLDTEIASNAESFTKGFVEAYKHYKSTVQTG